jgi:hypothetical protein
LLVGERLHITEMDVASNGYQEGDLFDKHQVYADNDRSIRKQILGDDAYEVPGRPILIYRFRAVTALS